MMCPKCKAERGRRSRRHGVLEHVASNFGYYPFRCCDCKHRFLRAGRRVLKDQPPQGVIDARAGRQARDWRRRVRDAAIYSMALLFFLAFLYFITRERNTPSSEVVRPPACSARTA